MPGVVSAINLIMATVSMADVMPLCPASSIAAVAAAQSASRGVLFTSVECQVFCPVPMMTGVLSGICIMFVLYPIRDLIVATT